MTNLFLGIISLIAFLGWVAVRVYCGIQFNIGIENYISQAASSPSPQVASDKLSVAIAEIERQRLTQGNTGVLFTYPTNDVGFWYKRLTDSRAILMRLPPGDAELEVSNTMMRVHESLVANGKEGSSVIAPEGISIFPHNVAFFWWGLLSLLFFCAFITAFAITEAL